MADHAPSRVLSHEVPSKMLHEFGWTSHLVTLQGRGEQTKHDQKRKIRTAVLSWAKKMPSDETGPKSVAGNRRHVREVGNFAGSHFLGPLMRISGIRDDEGWRT